MYRSAIQVWNGFAKNAREGLGSKHLIVPATVLLAGQVAPFVLLPFFGSLTSYLLAASIVLALLPRFIAVLKFQQSWLNALLHPVGIVILLLNQWLAHCSKIEWKGRRYNEIEVRRTARMRTLSRGAAVSKAANRILHAYTTSSC